MNTEEDFYSPEMEMFLCSNIETPMGKLIREIKKLDLSEFPIDIPNGLSEISFEYFNSLIARSNLTFDSISKESVYLQLLRTQDQHDVTVSSMINLKPANKTFGGYLSTLLINFTDEPFVLPAMGAFSYHYFNSRFINIPINPYIAILFIENNEPSRYIIDGKMSIARIDDIDIVKDINETAFISEVVGNRRWIVSPNKKELLELKRNFDNGIYDDLIEKFRVEYDH